MTNYHADAEELEKAAAIKIKQRDSYNARLDAIGDESRSTGPMTRNGNKRRHLIRANDSLMAGLGTRPIDLGAVFMTTNPTGLPLHQLLPQLWASVTAALNIPTANNDPARHVELRDDERYSYVYHTAFIGEKVARRLEQEMDEVRAIDDEIRVEYALGQHGPFSQHKQIAQLKDLYEMRVHPETGAIAFNQSRVSALQADMRCTGGACPITVFTPVSTASLRGIHIKAADPNSQDILKITPSDEANKEQAAAYVLRPGMHLRIDG